MAAGGLVAVAILAWAGADWDFGVAIGLAVGTACVCLVTRLELTDSTVTLRRGWSRASRRWVDLAVEDEARSPRFILFDAKEDEPGRACRFVAPADYERDWMRGRIGVLLRRHQPELMARIEASPRA